MSALSQNEQYEGGLDKQYIKEIFGGLNWNKFAERIAQQLQNNVNLTAEQRRLMQVNLVVALIRSNQIEQAKKEWEKFISSQDGAKSAALKGIGAFFSLKDKKYDEALVQVKGDDAYSIFLRAQILLAKKDAKSAFELLSSSLNDQLLSNDDYLIFLLRSSINHKISGDILSALINKLLSVKTPKQNKNLLLVLADLVAGNGNQSKALEILRSLYENHQNDKLVLGKLLGSLVDSGNLQEASKI